MSDSVLDCHAFLAFGVGNTNTSDSRLASLKSPLRRRTVPSTVPSTVPLTTNHFSACGALRVLLCEYLLSIRCCIYAKGTVPSPLPAQPLERNPLFFGRKAAPLQGRHAGQSFALLLPRHLRWLTQVLKQNGSASRKRGRIRKAVLSKTT